ncbi:MAG: hypothetical protein GMKNLPBB_02642 [Myxococcota bacterium]|nr:hypothetical protein [Myxococcota bacterium]
MKTLPAITDPVQPPVYGDHWFNRKLKAMLVEERDLLFVHLALLMAAVTIPFAALLYWPGMFSWRLAVIYWAINFLVFQDKYILMLHCTSHRALFRHPWRWLDKGMHWVLGPFYGEPPEVYFCHHLGMHHAENNLPGDLSSTMRFQRDSAVDFLRYFFRFLFFITIELSRYFRARGRAKLFRNTLVGELGFMLACVLLCFVNLEATLAVFIIPVIVVRFLMMSGNWAQHAFVDARDPGNSYKNSITCINTRYNRRCFNDGYHIGHHLKQTRHWTELPIEFQNDIGKYRDNNAVIFDGIDFFVVWGALMIRNYDFLADHFVDLTGQRTRDEIIALLKERTRRIPEDNSELAAVPAPA